MADPARILFSAGLTLLAAVLPLALTHEQGGLSPLWIVVIISLMVMALAADLAAYLAWQRRQRRLALITFPASWTARWHPNADHVVVHLIFGIFTYHYSFDPVPELSLGNRPLPYQAAGRPQHQLGGELWVLELRVASADLPEEATEILAQLSIQLDDGFKKRSDERPIRIEGTRRASDTA